MSTIKDTVEYLKNNTFIPHKNGNDMLYGLNVFGCNSIIQYNNDIWKFIWFISNTNDAVYVNKEGEQITITTYVDGVTRMQEV
jgi:hypothetical protein